MLITDIFENCKSKIVGFARWQHPHYLTDEQLAAKKAESEKEKKHPEGMNVALYNEFYGRLRRGRQRWIDHERTYCELDSTSCS